MFAFPSYCELRTAPLILGQETAGIIVGSPENRHGVTVDLLFKYIKCEVCKPSHTNYVQLEKLLRCPHRGNAFAGYLIIPHGKRVIIPIDVPFETAVLVDPKACGWQGARKPGGWRKTLL